jgi:GMP synthase (glutamine-hydrolysing)
MKLLIINNAEPDDIAYNMPLIQCLSRLSDVEVVNYKDVSRARITGYKGVVLSGVPKTYSYKTLDSRLPYLSWLKHSDLPVLGVCLGHQNIGRLYGASIIKNLEAEEGLKPLEVLQNSPLLEGLHSGQKIMTSHRGSVTLPEGFIQLASTSSCKNQVMKHAEKAIFSVQFHPELSANGIRLLSNFVKISDTMTSIPPVKA